MLPSSLEVVLDPLVHMCEVRPHPCKPDKPSFSQLPLRTLLVLLLVCTSYSLDMFHHEPCGCAYIQDIGAVVETLLGQEQAPVP
jgi:hypothetical protein